MNDRVKQNDSFVYWRPGSQNMGGYFKKHHQPHCHREICATYLYIENAQLKIYHKIVRKWANAVITPIHTFVITPNHNVLQGCDNAVRTYRNKTTKTVM